jgi:ribosomal RNA-processing protein 17
LREERKADLERHVREVNALLPSRIESTVDSDNSDDGAAEGGDNTWAGIDDESVEPIDHEAEYLDEDKYTTVTVEEVDISRDGISKTKVEGDDSPADTTAQPTTDGLEASKKSSTKSGKDKLRKPKKKKKAFRYESPADRKLNRAKERAKKSKAAKARRGE